MDVIKRTQFKIRLAATEQFVTNRNYSNEKIHVFLLVANFEEGHLQSIGATGNNILSTTGLPGKRVLRTSWYADSDGAIIAPAAVLKFVEMAKQECSL